MEANKGIRLYRDHFRVRPYGEPSGKGDWLDLGQRRSANPEAITQKYWKVAPHQVVGAVFIGRESNINLVDQTNREGIVEGSGFFDLRAALLKAVVFFEEKAHESALRRKVKTTSAEAKEKADNARLEVRVKAGRLKLHHITVL